MAGETMASLFKIGIQQLDKVGPRKAEQFRKLGVNTVGELLRFYPRNYEDWSHPLTIEEAAAQDSGCVKVTIEETVKPSRIKGGRTLFKVRVTDGTNDMVVTFPVRTTSPG